MRTPGCRPTSTCYAITFELDLNTGEVDKEKVIAEYFVLLSNVPVLSGTEIDVKKLLLTHEGQYGLESDLGFLKNPLVVNDIFPKKPHCIDTLGMILRIEFMVHRHMNRTIKKRV